MTSMHEHQACGEGPANGGSRRVGPGGRFALMVTHCAGMVDLVALPLWVGVLVAHYRFDPQQAGALVTMFLAGAVLASVCVAPRFERWPTRWLAPALFGCAAVLFAACSQLRTFTSLAALHAMGGVVAGTALSVTHGTAGRTDRPQRLFGWMQTALGIFGVAFMAMSPPIIAQRGGQALFLILASAMLAACVVAALWFPRLHATQPTRSASDAARIAWPRHVWYAILGISCMALTQAMVFSFLERMGTDRGFAAGHIQALLIVLGLVNLIPGALAAVLHRRLNPRLVLQSGAVIQAILAATVAFSSSFSAYALAGSVIVAVMIFSHVFCFGFLAASDPSGRAASATPAMLMTGGAVGPVLGGTLVKIVGYPGLGFAALIVDLIALWLFSRLAVTSKVARPGWAAGGAS